MNDAARLVAKVLVLERHPAALERLRVFCDDNALVGLKVQGDSALAVLRSNVDLGGIFLADDYEAAEGSGLDLARAIHAIRPELPIFLRVREASPAASADALANVRATYTLETIDALAPVIGQSIFCLVYPNALVRGISALSLQALASQFPGSRIEHEPPYIVHDRIIYGEMFTLIPLESSWCRGYMMLQTEEAPMRRLLSRGGLPGIPPGELGFRDLNNVLGETTNLMWGQFKNRFIAYGDNPGHLTQIPIVINHEHKFISFGSQDPQLCFRYTLSDPADRQAPPTHLYQRFIFNLSWSPDDFRENQSAVESLFASGELELF
jgi:hypothetical protein